MKKLLASAVLSAAAVSSAFAGDQMPKFSVAIDGYDIATNVYSVQGEYFMDENLSILVKPYLLNRSESGIDWSGYGMEISGRMYKEGEPEGLYYQAGLDVGYVKAEVGSISDDSLVLGLNAKTGYRFNIANRLFADIGAGIGYYTSDILYRDGDYRDLDGVELFGMLSLGYQF